MTRPRMFWVMMAFAGVSITTPFLPESRCSVKISKSHDRPMVTVNAGMSRFSGVVQADTVITNAVTPVTTGTPVITGSVQYLDVGLKLEVEPDVNPDHLVEIKVNLEVSSIAKEVPNAQSGTLAYQIGTRNASTVLRLRDGETQVLAGLISDQDRKTTVEVPYLGLVPVIGRLFSSQRDNRSKTEIVLLVTPRVVRNLMRPTLAAPTIPAGTDSAVGTQPLSIKGRNGVSLSSLTVPRTTSTATLVS